MNLNAQVVRAGRISPGIWAHGLCGPLRVRVRSGPPVVEITFVNCNL